MKFVLFASILLLTVWSSHAVISGLTSQIRGFTFTSNTAASPVVIIRFTGLTSNLTAGTDYNIGVGGATGAWSVTITNLASGNYTLSDDAGLTFAPYGGNGQLTLCMNPDIPQITIDTGVSTTFQGGASNRLRLRLRFLENNRYTNVFYRFRGGEINCNQTVSNTNDATYQVWARTASTASCGAPFMQLEQDFNTALSICNWFRDESNPSLTTFNATIIATTTDTGVVVRGFRFPRTLETGLVIRVSFQTNVSATLPAVSVFGSRITESRVTQQLWNPTSFTATVTVITSVQWPYMLSHTGLVPTVPALWSTATLVASPNETAADTFNGYINRARCYQTYTTTSATGTVQNAINQVCNQYWTVTLVRSASCGGGAVTLEGIFDIGFNVTCSPLFGGACTVPAPFNDQIRFSTNSTNYCPQLIANNNLNTASLSTFSNAAYSAAQNQYVFGTITYFEATVTSPILMNNVAAESILLTAGGTVGGANYYTRTFTSAGAWFGNSVGATYNTAVPAACGGSFSTHMSLTDNFNAGDSFTKRVRFTILWSACTSAATGDNPLTTTVRVNLRIRYTNQSTSATVPVLLAMSQKAGRLFDINEENVALATVGVATTGGVVDTPVASAAAGETMSALVIGVIAGVAALIVVVVAATVLVLRRNKSKTEHTSSVQLSSNTVTSQA